jgi:hypothetical protein
VAVKVILWIIIEAKRLEKSEYFKGEKMRKQVACD